MEDRESILSEKTAKDSLDVIVLEGSTSKCRIPIMSNRILVKSCEARVLGSSYTCVSGFSDVSSCSIPLKECSSGIIGEIMCNNTEEHFNFPSGESGMVICVESLESDTSSERSGRGFNSPDTTTLPATLRLLEEVSFRLLGEKTAPEIEIIEIDGKPSQQEELDDIDRIEDKILEDVDEVVKDSEEHHEYLQTVEYSRKFVDSILQSAKHTCKIKHEKHVALVSFNEELNEPQNIIWPTIEHFNIESGIESIDKYICHAFHLTESWKYKITFIIAQSDGVSDFYLYETKFCIPTSCYPIAQTTVSVLFTFEVSRVVPIDIPVRVTFTLESLRRTMVPGEVEVNDKMLLRVMYSKLAIFKEVCF